MSEESKFNFPEVGTSTLVRGPSKDGVTEFSLYRHTQWGDLKTIFAPVHDDEADKWEADYREALKSSVPIDKAAGPVGDKPFEKFKFTSAATKKQKQLPRCEKMDGSSLRIVPAYTEAGQFCEANCITVTDGERTAVYVPVAN